MKDKRQKSGQTPAAADLRKRAEEQAQTSGPANLSAQTSQEIQRALHELQVHQIELQMQNEELLRSHTALETSHQEFFDLYNFAPVGYCTLSEQGLILEANLTAATLLGTARSALIKAPLSRFILKEDQDNYYLHRKKLFESGAPQSCDLRMLKKDGSLFWACLTATIARTEEGAPVSHMILSDLTERKQAEVGLRASEQRFRGVFDQAAVGIALAGPDTVFMDTNAKFSQITGYTAAELRKMTVMEISHPDDMDLDQEYIERVIKGDIDNYQIEKRYIHRDGHIIWITLFLSVLRDTDGRVLYAIAAVEDITERKRVDEQLRENMVLLAQSQQIANIGSWRLDLKTNQLNWTDEVFRIFGHAPQSFSASYETFLAAVHPDERAAVDESYSRSLREGTDNYEIQHRIVRPGTGEVRDVHERCIHERDDTGAIIRSIGMVQDITERKKAQIQLAESEQRYSSLIEDTPILISRWLPDGTLTFVNRAYCDFFGKQAEELIGASIFLDIPAGEQDEVMRNFALLSPSNPVKINENSVIRHDGQVRWTRWTDRAFFDQDGKIIHYQSNGIDIHERRLAEDERDHLLHTLQQAQRIAHIGSWEWDIPNDVYYWSDELFRIYGRDPLKGAPTGEEHAAITHPADLALLRAARNGSLQTGTYACEYRLFRFDDGQERIVNAIGEVEFDHAGKPIWQRGTLQDVTEIRHAQTALQASEENNRRLVEHAGLGIGFYDLKGNILRMNRVACITMQTSEDQLIGRNMRDVYGKEMGMKFFDRLALAVQHSEPVSYEDLVSLPSGSAWFRSTYACIADESGQTIGLQIISEDVSAMKEAEMELAKSQTILENFSDAVIRTDLDGRITFWNKGAQDIFGYTAEEIQGKPVSMLWWPEGLPSLEKYINLLRSGSDVQDQEIALRTREDRTVQTLLSLLPLKNADGEVIELVGFSKDITTLKQAQTALEESARALSTLLGNLPGMAYRCDNDADWTMRFVSQGCEDLTGYTEDELLMNAQVAYADLIHPADRALVSRQVRENLQAGMPFEITYRIRCKDGGEKWVWEKGSEVKELTTGRFHLEGFISDITARIMGQEALREHARFLDTIMEFSPIAMFIADINGVITRTNRTLRETLQLTESQLIGKYNVRKDQNLVEQGAMPQVEAAFTKKESARLTIFWKAENTGHTDLSGGNDLWVDASLFPVLNEDGSINSVICQWVDVTKQITAAHKLRESEQHYLSVAEDAPMMIIRYLPDGTITFTNSHYTQFFCGKKDGLPWKTIYDKYAPEKKRQVKKDLAALTPENPIRNVEGQCERFDGQMRWLRWKDCALYDSQGVLTGYQAFGEDMHEQHLAEQKLQESERALETLMGNLPGIAYRGDGDARFAMRFLSQGCQDLTGYSPQELVDNPQRTFESIMHPDDVEMVISQIRQAVENAESFELSYRIFTKNGEQRWVLEKGIAFAGEKGQMATIQGFITDITERIQAQAKLAESEARFRAFMDNFPANAYIKDENLRHVFVNRAASEFAGIPQEEYIGKTTADIYSPEMAAKLEAIDRTVLDKQFLLENEDYYLSPSGERRYQRDIKFPIAGMHGEKLVGGIALDLTAQKEAEECLITRAKFEKMLAEISISFLGVEADQFDGRIINALTRVGKHLEIDRIVVSLLNEDNTKSYVAYVWSEKVLQGVQEKYDFKNYPWLFSTSIHGNTILWSLNDGLPKKLTKAEKELFTSSGIKSLASLPIQISGKVGASIIFSDMDNPEKFTPDLSESLLLFAQIISNAITLKDAQSAISESEQRYRSVVEDAPVLINRYQKDGTIIFANQAYSELFGKPIEELIGRKFYELMPQDSKSAARQRLANLSAEKPYYTSESKVVRHDGQERWVRWTVRCLLNSQGQIETVQSFGVDVTDQRLAAERLADSERQFRSLFTEMATGFSLYEVITDDAGKAVDIAFVQVNRAFEEITGLQQDEVAGQPITAVLPDFDRGWLQDYIDVALHDLTFHHKDFNQRLGIYTDIRAFSPRAGQCAVLMTDISEQENLYHQIEIERDKAQHYLDTVQSIVIGLDKEGNLTLSNPKACQTLGYSEAELIGKNWFDTCLPPENRDEIKNVFRKIMQGDLESVQYYENLVRTRSGETLVIAWHNAMIADREGKFIGVLSSGEDITARKAAEQRIHTLLEISEKLITESYGANVLQTVADQLLQKIDSAQAVTIWLYDGVKEQLTVHAMTGFDDKNILGMTVNASEGIVGQVASSRQALILRNTRESERFTTLGGIAPEMVNIQSLLCAPLVFHDKLLGAICVDNFDQQDAFSDDDLILIESISNQLSGIVENALLFAEIESNRAELRALSRRLLEVHEEERRAVALDLHDHFGQILTTFKLSLRPEAFIKHSEDEQRARLAEVTTIVDELIEAAEDLSLRLRPSILDDLGLIMAIEWHTNRFARQTGIPVTLNISMEKGKRFHGMVEITLYRVLEESLSNALQHGSPSRIEVDLREKDGMVMMIVSDNGIGFNLDQIENSDYAHTGLTGMQERVRLINGIIDIRSEPKKGTTIQLMVPLNSEKWFLEDMR